MFLPLICTDAAAEGLNFQFCGALINYDMPWNPMRVEQRIGRIDRLGQKYPNIQIINLHYSDTVETDVYRALRQRIGLFEGVVGRLQPILARLPTLISNRVLEGKTKPAEERQAIVSEIEAQADQAQAGGFDIDEMTDSEISEPVPPPSPLTMNDLEQVIARPPLLPAGIEVEAMGVREYKLRQPGMNQWVRVSTDPAYYEQHADNIELWSPGNPTFPSPPASIDSALAVSLAELLAADH